MKILITGGTGFLGKSLSKKLSGENKVTVLDRNLKTAARGNENTEYIEADLAKPGQWQELIPKQDIIINLAGATIFKKWDKKTKEAIYNSRIMTTRNLVDALKGKKPKNITLLSTSAIGYYGFHDDEIIDESFAPGNDFLAGVARDWENEANRAVEYGVRVINCRFGIILGKNGGALGIMIPLFKYFLGARLGSGSQWFSWIHEKDLVDIFEFLIKNKNMKGAVNCTSPNPVTNRDLTRELKTILKRPSIVPFVPAFALRIVLGEFGDLVLKGQRAVPKKLADNGFSFSYPEISVALDKILS